MKLYSMKRHRNVERQVHFGLGKGTKTACGQYLYSRYVMVSIFSTTNPSLIVSDMAQVTCKRCLKTGEFRLRKLLSIEAQNPGIFNSPSLCGEQWLLNHALDVSKEVIEAERIEVVAANKILTLILRIPSKDRKYLLSEVLKREGG